jgi:hypothetical protein
MVIRGVVKYWDLGRGKAKGTFTVVAKDDEEFNDILEREFKKHLVSENVGFDADRGNIYAGIHTVGHFSFIAKKLNEVI